MIYWDLIKQPTISQANSHVLSELQWLAAFGSLEKLELCLNANPTLDVNLPSRRGETPLYLACARGSWKHAEKLLTRGARPEIKFAQTDITCLHYPFVLPAGGPLHWAAATSHHAAIKAPIKANVNPLLRNHSDPYIYDDRICSLYALGGPDAESRTFAESHCHGLHPLDPAAINRDPYLFRILEEQKITINLNSADEEGFTVIHRLATSQIFRTSRRSRYCPRLFRGNSKKDLLEEIIRTAKRLGADLNMLAKTSNTRQTQGYSWKPYLSSYTPLVLAMLESDHDLVEALLNCGANVDATNDQNQTALFAISHRARFEQPNLLKCIQTLVEQKANIHHKSSEGNTALMHVAYARKLDTFKYFLSKGSAISERDRSKTVTFKQRSVLAYFASTEDADENILNILEQYVFSEENGKVKQDVINGCDAKGRTLLHESASEAMLKCTEAMSEQGAEINAMERMEQGGVKRVRYETPLDSLQTMQQTRKSYMRKRKTYSSEEIGAILKRGEITQAVLRKHGARSSEFDDINIHDEGN